MDPSKTSGPMGGGGGYTKTGRQRTNGGGRGGGRPTSISDDFEQIFCVSDTEDPCPRPSVAFGRFRMILPDVSGDGGKRGGRGVF